MDVEFLWPFKIEYVMLDISSDCKTMLIGTDSRRYAWILSREPRISEEVRKDYMKRLDTNGFDISKMYLTQHKGAMSMW